MLIFWGVGCAPCIKEIPELNKLVEKYHLENVKFIAPATYPPEETIEDHFLAKTN